MAKHLIDTNLKTINGQSLIVTDTQDTDVSVEIKIQVFDVAPSGSSPDVTLYIHEYYSGSTRFVDTYTKVGLNWVKIIEHSEEALVLKIDTRNIQTGNNATPDNSYMIPVHDSVNNSTAKRDTLVLVDWGDGTGVTRLDTSSIASYYQSCYHEYTTPGEYIIRLWGRFGIQGAVTSVVDNMAFSRHTHKTLEVIQFGDVNYNRLSFTGQVNLIFDNLVDKPNIQGKSVGISFQGLANMTHVPGINEWSTGNVTNMDSMFSNCRNFNQSLNFDTGNVSNMQRMFAGCNILNSPIILNTSNVTTMSSMFNGCHNFNQPLEFDTGNVTIMSGMFYNCRNFNQPITLNTSSVTNMTSSFLGCTDFDQPLNFDTGNVIHMYQIFRGCSSFNQPVTLVTSNVTDMRQMFYECTSFNQPLEFDTSNVTTMSSMLQGCTSFNESIALDTSKVTDMNNMFYNCINFNQPVNFNTNNVTSMANTFYGCTSFNQPLEFDTSNVTTMSSMFNRCTDFDQPLNFDTSKVGRMDNMFNRSTYFNQPLNFDTSNVSNMSSMFEFATSFNQDISNFNFESLITSSNNTSFGTTNFMRYKSAASYNVEYYDNLLNSIASQDIQPVDPAHSRSNTLHMNNIQYSSTGVAARLKIVNDFGWTIIDGGQI